MPARVPCAGSPLVTVIAYSSKHRIIASDSRCFDHHTDAHVTNVQKLFRLRNGALLGIAGDADVRDLVTLLSRATPRKMPSRAQLAELKSESDAVLVFPKGQVFTVSIERDGDHAADWVGDVLPIRDTIVAIGCGSAYALGAMEAGASPIQAIRATCRRDLYCALPVQWEPLDLPATASPAPKRRR